MTKKAMTKNAMTKKSAPKRFVIPSEARDPQFDSSKGF
jgi:hypothetical protein